MARGKYETIRKKRLSTPQIILLTFFLLMLLTGIFLLTSHLIKASRQRAEMNQGLDDFRQFMVTPTVATTPTTPAVSPTEEKLTLSEQQTEPTEAPIFCPELLEAMHRYNEALYESKQQKYLSAKSFTSDKEVKLSDYGIPIEEVGIVSIPSISVEMSLYLGASDAHMAKGFAQLAYTSMPVGGTNTNCVIAGHRGWRGADYMINADKIKLGDRVYLQNFWETLEYEVVKIEEVERHEIEKCLIQEGKDMITLFTCTPVGIGTRRLLIFCERILPSPNA